MFERLKNYIASRIRMKFLISISLVTVISVSFVTFFSVSAYNKRLESNYNKYSSQVLNNYIRNVNNYFNELETIMDTIQYNFYIQEFFIDMNNTNADLSLPDNQNRRYTDNYKNSMEALSGIITLRHDINAVFILGQGEVKLYKTRFSQINDDALQSAVSEHRQALVSHDLKYYYDFSKIEYFESPFNGLSISRQLDRYIGQGTLGLIHLNANLNIFETLTSSAVLGDNVTLIVLDQDGDYLTSSFLPDPLNEDLDTYTNELKNVIKSHAGLHDGENFILTSFNQEPYHIVYKPIDKTGWIVAALVPHHVISAEVNEIRNSIILITFISLFIIIFITYLITNRILKPISILKQSMDLADHNQFDQEVEVTSVDEIGNLSASFNHMIVRIKNLMEALIVEQGEKRKAELRTLQNQINPHFLYNTLETIIWLAETDDENTVPMIEALSRLFRLSLNKGQELITIEDELDHVRNYLYILKIRYLNKFDYTITCSPLLYKHKIPKIILQPLIENAIYHGIKNSPEKGHIHIDAVISGEDIIISITDNGIGMDQKTCEKLLAGEPSEANESDSGSGIGIRNVNQRIKLYYGKKYGLAYKSETGKGTTVTVTLPI